MRVYLPASVVDLAAPDGISGRPAHAVTPGLRAASPGESEEDLEVSAFLDAADASLALLTTADVPCRVVVAADVDSVAPIDGGPVTTVRAPAVRWRDVVSFHVDDPADPAAATTVGAAIGGVDAAIEAAADLDLLWYDASERAELLAQLGPTG
jgi:hypothetical protein